MNILGVNGWNAVSHDAAACLVRDGRLVLALEEERPTRNKHAQRLAPEQSTQYVLHEAKLQPADIDVVAYGWDVTRFRPDTLPSQLNASDERALEVLFPKALFPRRAGRPEFRRVQHHLAHAYHAYYSSPFVGSRTAMVIVDGMGEREATSTGVADGSLKLEHSYGVETSLGLLYGAASEFLGYGDLDGGKLMALAALEKPEPSPLDDLNFTGEAFVGFPAPVPMGSPGSVDVASAVMEQWAQRFETWFKLKPLHWPNSMSRHFRFERARGQVVPREYKVFAASLQKSFERVMTALVTTTMRRYDTDKVVIAGGVALNCAANGKLRRAGAKVHVPSAPGDSGVAIGAALAVAVGAGEKVDPSTFVSQFLGPDFSDEDVRRTLTELGIPFRAVEDPSKAAAELLAADNIVGWFQGRSEFGPRALGNRSILANPAGNKVKDRLNDLKGRELWRPVGISILAERAGEVLANVFESPHMMAATPCLPEVLKKVPDIAHLDGTTRPQVLERSVNPKYHALIENVAKLTGWPMVINTSFNRYDEPIVHSPEDAIRTFFTSSIDALVVGNCVVRKKGGV